MDNKIKEHFKNHNKSEVFQTSDGFLFHKDFDAKAHAASLKDKAVTRFERGSVELAKAESETGAQAADETTKKEAKGPKAPKEPKATTVKKAGGRIAKGAKAPKAEQDNNPKSDAIGAGEAAKSE